MKINLIDKDYINYENLSYGCLIVFEKDIWTLVNNGEYVSILSLTFNNVLQSFKSFKDVEMYIHSTYGREVKEIVKSKSFELNIVKSEKTDLKCNSLHGKFVRRKNIGTVGVIGHSSFGYLIHMVLDYDGKLSFSKSKGMRYDEMIEKWTILDRLPDNYVIVDGVPMNKEEARAWRKQNE